MQVRIPSPKEIKQKIVDHPTAAYFGFLGVVFLASYGVSRTLAKTAGVQPYDLIMEDLYEHASAGDHLVLTFPYEKFYYAPYDPDQQAS